MYLIGFALMTIGGYVVYLANVARDNENKHEIIANENRNAEHSRSNQEQILDEIKKMNRNNENTKNLLVELFGKNYSEILNNKSALDNLKNKLNDKSLEFLVQENHDLKESLDNLSLNRIDEKFREIIKGYILTFNYEEALKQIRAYLDDDSKVSANEKSEIYKLQSYAYEGLGDKLAQEKSLHTALLLDGNNPDLLLEYGNILDYNGKYKEAKIYLRKAYDIYTHESEENLLFFIKHHRYLASVHSSLEEFSEAIKLLEEIISLDLDKYIKEYRYDLIYLEKAKALTGINKNNKALISFKKSLEIGKKYNLKTPSLTEAHTYNAMSILYDVMGKYDLSIAQNDTALEIYKLYFPNDKNMAVADAYHNRGVAELHQYKLPESINSLVKSKDITISIYGENHAALSKTYEALGGAYALSEDYEKSETSLEKAYSLILKYNSENKSMISIIKSKLEELNKLKRL